MPIFHLQKSYPDTWVVLDRSCRVIDSGQRLDLLRRKHGAHARRTFCFVCAPGEPTPAPEAAPWSLRGLLGYAPAGWEPAAAATAVT